MKYFISLLPLFVALSSNAFAHVRAKLEAEGIVGGTDASVGEVKYQISLENEAGNICGGGIIADRYVLTAAHCVTDPLDQIKLPALTVLAASLKARTRDDPNAVRIEVEKIYVPKEFKHVDPPPGEFYRTTADLAVLKLNRGLGIATNPLLSALQLPRSANESYADETTVVAGFGDNWVHIYEDAITGDKIDFGGGSNDSLRYAEARVFANDDCSKHFNDPISSTHLCAAVLQRDPNVGEGVCSGDSGSPLVLNGATVIGILSSSPIGCTEADSPAVYTRVSSYLSFIRDVLNDNITSEVRVAVLRDRQIHTGYTIKIYEEIH